MVLILSTYAKILNLMVIRCLIVTLHFGCKSIIYYVIQDI